VVYGGGTVQSTPDIENQSHNTESLLSDNCDVGKLICRRVSRVGGSLFPSPPHMCSKLSSDGAVASGSVGIDLNGATAPTVGPGL